MLIINYSVPSGSGPISFYFISLTIKTDTVHPLNFDWTRSDVEPLWLYEHVEAAKWNVEEVAAFVKWVLTVEMVLSSTKILIDVVINVRLFNFYQTSPTIAYDKFYWL